MHQRLVKLILAGVVAAILTLGPAQAFHKGVVHGGGAGEPTEIQTLDNIDWLYQSPSTLPTAAAPTIQAEWRLRLPPLTSQT